MNESLILPPAVALLVSASAVPALAAWARSRRLLDVPNHRSSHTVPTPRVGGVGIVLAICAGALIAGRQGAPFGQDGALIAAGALAIAALSLLDDIRPLPATVRLMGHFIIAGGVAFGLSSLYVPLDWIPETPARLLLVAWIVGMVNAYNFMDGIDGLAGGQAILAASAWALASYLIGSDAFTVFWLVTAAAVAAFVRLNWHPARVFMGDAGSAFLGYVFATVPLAMSSSSPAVLGAALLLMWPFVFDTAFTFFRRLRRGENVLQAHRSHLYQRLAATGLSHDRVTLLYLALAAIGFPAALLAVSQSTATAVFSFAALVPLAAAALWAGVARREYAVRRRAAAGAV